MSERAAYGAGDAILVIAILIAAALIGATVPFAIFAAEHSWSLRLP